MWKNYLLTSLRFFSKNKGFSLLNLVGLCAGTTCCIYILLYVREQYSYDRDLPDASSIFRVVSTVKARNGSLDTRATTTPPLAEALENEYPVVATRMLPTIGSEKNFLAHDNVGVYENEAYYIDRNFFKVFGFRFLRGNGETALDRPDAVVISRKLADQFFEKDDPMGERIYVSNNDGDQMYTVTGIIDESSKSSLHANIYILMNPQGLGGQYLVDDHWLEHYYSYTFIKLKPNTSADDLAEKLPEFLSRHSGAQLGGRGGVAQLQLQRLTSMHTTGGYESEMSKTVDGYFLALLFGIASLIQLIACINFMNLATARASRRAKEVGVRKIIGADNTSLVMQFLAESVALALMAVLIALPVLVLVLPWLNEATGAEIPRTVFFQPAIWLLLIVLALVTGLLAGSYPAFYLSAFQAPRVLKGDFTSHVSAGGIRRSLVVFQFALSIILIAGMLIVGQQLNFIRNKDLGYSKDEQIVLSFHTWGQKRVANYFAIAMRQIPEIASVSLTNNYPGATNFQSSRVYLDGSLAVEAIGARSLNSDEYFLQTMGIRLVSGRDFHADDTGSVIINEAMMHQLNLDARRAPGTTIFTTDRDTFKIAGVMKDFNYQSLHEAVAPFMIVYRYGPAALNKLIIRAHPLTYAGLLRKMETIWRRRVWIAPFVPQFLSDEVQLLYSTEIIMSRIVECFTVIAIIISCLGLFGLAAFDAEQRTKEIGIRKVMGASVSGIVALLSGGFFRLISTAVIVAVPISWWIMTSWLKAFAYHIRIGWWVFGVAGGSTILVAMAVVTYQAMRAAVVNPVKSLRAD
jgi:putative ABC transport system permease protein